MKKIIVLLAFVSGVFAFSQNTEKLYTLNGKIASENLINEIKGKKGTLLQTGKDSKFKKVTFSKANFDFISIKKLNTMNGLPENTPIVVDGIQVDETEMDVFVERFAALEKRKVGEIEMLHIFSKTNL